MRERGENNTTVNDGGDLREERRERRVEEENLTGDKS